jgi:hypothetical protein
MHRVSEYQYYEFLALDRPLDASQQAEVRTLSTRARITATRFTNDYQWGEFKGDPRLLMERYYDAHLYLADWGTHRVMLRLPEHLVDRETVEQYCFQESVTAWTSQGRLILDISSEEESGDWDGDEDIDDSLAAIAGVRAELMAGDHRALYLAWLSALTVWELQDDDEEAYQAELEPPVPAGLGRLTAPQRALADFLRVDDHLLAAAAEADPDAADARPCEAVPRPGAPDLARWVAELPASEKDALLLNAARGNSLHLGAELMRRYRTAHCVRPALAAERRSAAQLLDAAAGLRSRH